MLSVAILVGALVLGGYWMQQQRPTRAELRQQANVYETYLYNTRNTPGARARGPIARSPGPASAPVPVDHPAVTPAPLQLPLA